MQLEVRSQFSSRDGALWSGEDGREVRQSLSISDLTEGDDLLGLQRDVGADDSLTIPLPQLLDNVWEFASPLVNRH